MEDKIAIIVTSFLRNKLLERIIGSILSNWKDEYLLLIGNQGILDQNHLIYLQNALNLQEFKAKNSIILDIIDPNSQKVKKDALIAYNNRIRYYALNWDCGLSYARNYLVQRAYELGCNYIFLTADSYEFKEKYNLEPIIKFLESDNKNGLVGFVEEGKPDPKWCWDIELIPNQYFLLKKPTRPIINFEGLKFIPCDVTQNFYLAKIKILLEVPYDENLKLCEHEDAHYRFKQAGWKVFFNDSIACKYINEKSPQYNEKRRRIYTEYKQKLLKKYNLKSWIRIER